MVGVPLHHLCALLKVLSLVVNPSNTLCLVAELGLDMVSRIAMLVEDCAGDVAEAMTCLATFVTKAPECHKKNGIASGFGAVASTWKQEWVSAG